MYTPSVGEHRHVPGSVTSSPVRPGRYRLALTGSISDTPPTDRSPDSWPSMSPIHTSSFPRFVMLKFSVTTLPARWSWWMLTCPLPSTAFMTAIASVGCSAGSAGVFWSAGVLRAFWAVVKVVLSAGAWEAVSAASSRCWCAWAVWRSSPPPRDASSEPSASGERESQERRAGDGRDRLPHLNAVPSFRRPFESGRPNGPPPSSGAVVPVAHHREATFRIRIAPKDRETVLFTRRRLSARGGPSGLRLRGPGRDLPVPAQVLLRLRPAAQQQIRLGGQPQRPRQTGRVLKLAVQGLGRGRRAQRPVRVLRVHERLPAVQQRLRPPGAVAVPGEQRLRLPRRGRRRLRPSLAQRHPGRRQQPARRQRRVAQPAPDAGGPLRALRRTRYGSGRQVRLRQVAQCHRLAPPVTEIPADGDGAFEQGHGGARVPAA